MEFKSEQKHLLLSPRKIRPVVDVIKKLTPSKALEVLPFVKKRASEFLSKVIKSAIANASQKGVSAERLLFKEIQIGEGPRLKRGQPVSRGRWHPIKKRMSHIKVILMSKRELKNENNTSVKEKVVDSKQKSKRKVLKNGTKS